MRLSKVDLVQFASRWEGLEARRSSAARVAVAVEDRLAPSDEEAAAARACGRAAHLLGAGSSAASSRPRESEFAGTVPSPPGANGPFSKPRTSSEARSTKN